VTAVSHEEVGVEEGQVLAGKYRIEKVLGVGGMGIVVAARHIQLDTKVAIKFLAQSALGNIEAVARFAREARAAVKITGEHVARVLDVGTLENGAPYMVMEFLEGSDLAAWLAERGALPIDQAVEFVLQACVAVAEAHSLGIVHRDLKPANLFCIRRADGKLSAKVLDFGISKINDPSGPDSRMSVTRTTSVMGSPLYMSPEQMQAAKSVDARADIWALGIILYELLTATVPFEGETITDVAIKVATDPTPPVRTRRPDVPPGLDAAILRCLEKRREQRFASVADLALALREFAPSRAVPLVERICDILQVAPPSYAAPPPSQMPSQPQWSSMPQFAPTSLSGGVQPGVPAASGVAATMAAVARTGGHTRGGGKRPIALALLGVAIIGIGGAVLFASRRVPASSQAAALSQAPSAAPSGSIASPPTAPVVPAASQQATLPPTPTAETPAEIPPTTPAPTKMPPAGARPGTKATTPKSTVTAAAPPATTAAPHGTPPSSHKNSLDLGGFQ
jgi:serine/threonine-protein kinase